MNQNYTIPAGTTNQNMEMLQTLIRNRRADLIKRMESDLQYLKQNVKDLEYMLDDAKANPENINRTMTAAERFLKATDFKWHNAPDTADIMIGIRQAEAKLETYQLIKKRPENE